MRHDVKRVLSMCVSVLLLTTSGYGLHAEEDPKETPELKVNEVKPLTQDSASLQLALLLKMLADEEFRRGDHDEAKTRYKRALAEAEGIAEDGLSAIERSTLELLKRDIDYRLDLLQSGQDFRGVIVARTPTIPINHLNEMVALQREFEQLYASMTMAEDELGADKEKMGEITALLQGLEGKLQEHAPKSEALDIRESDFRTHLDIARGRLDVVRETRLRMEAETNALSQQSSAAMSQLNQMLVEGIAQAVGVPKEVTLLTSSEPLEQRLLKYAASDASILKNAKLSGTLAEIQQHTDEIVTYYNDAKTFIDDVNSGVESVRQIGDMLREPTWERMVAAGDEVFKHLPETDRRDWQKAVTDARPAVALLDLVQKGNGNEVLQAAAAKYLAAHRDARSIDIDRLLLEAHAADLTQWFPQFLRELTPTTMESKRRIAEAEVKIWTEGFLRLFDAQQLKILRDAQNVATDAELRARLAANGWGDLSVSANNEDLIISARSQKIMIRLDRIRDLSKAVPNADALRKEAASLVNYLATGATTALQTQVLNALPIRALQNVANEFVRSAKSQNDALNRRAKLWDEMMKPVSEEKQAEIVKDIAVMRVGSAYVSGTFEQAARAAAGQNLPAAGGQFQQRAKNDPSVKAMTMALNAAIPGAGMAVDVLSGIEKARALASRAREKQAQVRSLMAEELMLHDAVREYRRDSALVEKEQQVAAIKARTALAQLHSYTAAIDQVIASSAQQRFRVQVRRPLFFYTAERLREEFDALDRSLALWMGRTDSRGTLSWYIRSDPQMLRYALDPDIHLFDWLDRDLEASRSDVERLNAYWKQVLRLSNDVCKQTGACPGNAFLGQTATTREILLSEMMNAEDWQRFQLWQKSESKEPFRASFFVTPTMGVVPAGHQNVRVIDVRIGARIGNEVRPVHQLGLRHAGFSYILGPDGYRKEALAPTKLSFSFDPPVDFDRQEIETRWSRPAVVQRDFEGYGLYGLWQIEVHPDVQNRSATEIAFRFAYHFQTDAVLPPEARPLDPLRDRFLIPLQKIVATSPATPTKPAFSIEIPVHDLQMLAPPGEKLADAIQKLQTTLPELRVRPSFNIQVKDRTAAEVRPLAIAEVRARLVRDAGPVAAKNNAAAIEEQARKEANAWIVALRLE